jgi:hypothetical protein
VVNVGDDGDIADLFHGLNLALMFLSKK